ncbi:aldo/keto reductase [Microlunatus flavus]|uniref:D-threo-aldose 1-dehydrogenase n=1 Tax=Microlunatus flavus TaxID=1036181 RepID=A0A1H9KEA3_9ACTN|nr:aldo/keto reductase [Microlunatus flavus]SEQ97193.1 D-threo-aldose 1-dehydrogenase [Microlunatus flavus]
MTQPEQHPGTTREGTRPGADPQLAVGSWRRALGATGLQVSAVCIGAAPLGGMPAKYGTDITDDQAVDLVRAVLGSPFRFLDTSNGYSEGRSEARIGRAVRLAGGVPDDFLLATKVDAKDGDYSGDRVRRSAEESLERLGVDHLPLLHLHDPEHHDAAALTGPGGAVEALVALRDEGVVDHLGLAGGDVSVMDRYLDLGVFEVLLTHNRWTLVDGSAGPLLERCAADGVGVVNAAVFGGGVLARPEAGITRYAYRPVRPATAAAVAAMAAACRRAGTTLGTAALQHSLRDPRVDSTVVGVSRPDRLASLLEQAVEPLPDALWEELAELRPSPEHWIDVEGSAS